MPQPAHASLLQQCVHAVDSSSLQDAVVSNFVLKGDAQNATETAHVDYIEFLFLSDSQGPRFSATKEGDEDAGSAYLDFGVLCQLSVGPHSLCQSGYGRGCFSDALVELCVEREGVRDGGTQV